MKCNRTPTGLEDVSKFPNLFAELLARGWSESDLEKVAGLNLLRVFRGTEAVGYLHFTLYIRKCISTLMFLFWYHQRFVIKWQPTESNLSTNGFHKRTYQRKLCLAQLANINRNSCRLNSSFYTY